MNPYEVAYKLGGTIIRRREAKNGVVREVHREPGWHFLDCRRCGKALSANSHRRPRRNALCSRCSPAPAPLARNYAKASNARKEMIAALAVWKTQSKYKRYDRERALKQYIEELKK